MPEDADAMRDTGHFVDTVAKQGFVTLYSGLRNKKGGKRYKK